MKVDFPGLKSINDGLNLAYNTQFWAASTIYKTVSSEFTSTGAEEVYPRLNMTKGLREFIGEREVNRLSLDTFRIRNKKFEETIAISRDDVEDDKYGIFTPLAATMGMDAGQQPDLMISSLIKNGHTTLAADGQNFFDTSHENYNEDGSVGTLSNYQPAPEGYSGPSWYVFDTSKPLRPFIFQNRDPFQLVSKFALTDENVFWDDEFIWGIRGRCGAGYGLWQLAYRSDAPPTAANLVAARTAMASWRRPNGTPMGVKSTLVMGPTALYPQLRAYCNNEMLPPADPAATGAFVGNDFKGLAEAIENPWLN